MDPEPGEDKDSWLNLLNRLTERGLHPDFGLELFVTDGGGGLLAPRQRCVFPKIRARLRKAGAFHSLAGLLVCLPLVFPISPPPIFFPPFSVLFL